MTALSTAVLSTQLHLVLALYPLGCGFVLLVPLIVLDYSTRKCTIASASSAAREFSVAPRSFDPQRVEKLKIFYRGSLQKFL